MTGLKELTSPDEDRCQAEKPNGASFMTLGGRPGRVRCTNAPVVVIKEERPGLDGLLGGMSLCAHCYLVFEWQVGAQSDVSVRVLSSAQSTDRDRVVQLAAKAGRRMVPNEK